MKKYFVQLLLGLLLLWPEHGQLAAGEEDIGTTVGGAEALPTPDESVTFEREAPFVPSTQSPMRYLPMPRIVGGMYAVDGQFPYQASVLFRGSHICGGTIISPNYVLTAAHCVTDSIDGRTLVYAPSTMAIRVGSIQHSAGGLLCNVSAIKVHPNYLGFNDDIALMRLSEPLVYTNHIRSIALNTDVVPSGMPVVISGWGRISTTGPVSPFLKHVTLHAMSNEECGRDIGPVPASILCLGKKNSGSGACSGDSGGPAVIGNSLIGVANFVVGGCGLIYPDGYARVSSYVPWIRLNSDVLF